ncbi:MAG: hypothetical protein U9R02_04650, partial [Thermodesulfobacteriota bacterium]|nr:hypothetical protein [Thermodesulfobacteriota bacterium]
TNQKLLFRFCQSPLADCLVPMLQRGNPYGMRSHAGAWEREKKFLPMVEMTIRGGFRSGTN